ncbi:serine/threonine-protein kinase [uncultured Methanobacterium sp.]|uniref:serine/threonine-protein kinase n=1 Tax=uncultured Methanobacterium sp. TaxID=176306 RepID=UPI002AA6146C|nr:serine/threonine-protein kinase [uncultured Methanobacterium sp.]
MNLGYKGYVLIVVPYLVLIFTRDYYINLCVFLVIFSLILSITIFKIRKDEIIGKYVENFKTRRLIISNIIITIYSGYFLLDMLYVLFFSFSDPSYDLISGMLSITLLLLIVLISILCLKNLKSNRRINKKHAHINFFLGMGIVIFFGITLMGENFNVEGSIIALYAVFTSMLVGIPFYVPNIIILQTINGYNKVVGRPKTPIDAFSKRFKDTFHNTKYIGEGGFAWVYRVTNIDDKKEYAIKIPKIDKKNTGKTFVKEAANWNLLDHPNIVKIHNINIIETPYIEMEYCDGPLKEEKMDLADSVNIIYDLAEGLRYAHSKNIIHGDIKPSNILMKNNQAKISDWGLSKLKTDKSVTLSGFTPQYAAPEQISSEYGKGDERTDIYQLGGVAYMLLTGQPPLADYTPNIYEAILNQKPDPITKYNPQAKNIEPIIMKCLEKQKKDRYQNMNQLIKDLNQYKLTITQLNKDQSKRYQKN